MSKNIYIAGPMTGLPYFNFPSFFKAEKELTDKGYNCFNPARKDVDKYGDVFDYCETGTHEEFNKLLSERGIQHHPSMRDFAKLDLNWIIDNADAICPLENWQKSKGARTEMALAEWLGLEVIKL